MAGYDGRFDMFDGKSNNGWNFEIVNKNGKSANVGIVDLSLVGWGLGIIYPWFGSWNSQVQFYLNAAKVLEFTMFDQELTHMIEDRKF